MSLLFILVAHLLVTLARLARPGGVRAVAAESLAVKHLLLIMNRSRLRSPNLTPWDRVILGFCTLLVSPRRLGRIAVNLEDFDPPASSASPGEAKISFALQPRATPAPRTQGPVERADRRGGRDETAQPVVRLPQDRRAIFSAFGIALKKHVVRRILVRHYPPEPDGGGPSWLAAIGHAKDRVWSVDLFRAESILLKSHWILVVMDVYIRRILGFGVAAAHLDGIRVCRMFNYAIARQTLPRHLSTDNDRCFVFIAGERTFGYSKSMR